jgi:hypothetical protein
MKFLSTWVMAALVAVLAAYTFYEFKNSDDNVSSDKGEHRVFSLLRDDIEEISINARGVETVIQRQGDKWTLIKPIEDLAEASAVEGFVYSLLVQKGKDFRTDTDKAPVWSEFGLDPAGSKVVVRGKGKTETLEISSKNAFDGSFYIRVKDQLWLGDRALAQLLEREPASFRSRKVYRGPEQVNAVEVALDYLGEKQEYAVKRADDNALWKLEPDPGFAVDSAKVASWVQKIQALNGTEFMPEVPKGKPSLVLKLGGSQITFSSDIADQVFVMADQRPAVYRVAASALDTLRVPKIYFRDGRAPFKFPVELVREIEIHSGEVNNQFVKKDANWEVKQPVAGVELDQEKLVSLIQSVQSLDAAEFVDNGQGFPATPQLSFRDAAGKTLLTVAWGNAYKPKYSFNKGQSLIAVRVSGLKEVIGLPKDKLDHLVDSAIIRKTEKK